MDVDLIIRVPSWVSDVLREHTSGFDTLEDRMRLAISLSAQNVARGGGPFGAAVFSGARCIAAGVNRVLDSGYSIAHAEIVALMTAQRESAASGGVTSQGLTLVTSAEPCCQCFGAVVWAGVEHLVCGATTSDVEIIGFDEGPKPRDWQQQLRERAIQVTEHVLRDEAVAVLHDYRARGGTIYGQRHPRVS